MILAPYRRRRIGFAPLDQRAALTSESFLYRSPFHSAEAVRATSAFGAPLASLRLRTSGPGEATSLPIRRVSAGLGSDAGNDVVLAGDGVAPHHARLQLRGGVWTVVDLDPQATSWVDGEVVQGEAVLAPGSIIRLGTLGLVFDPEDRWQDSPAEEEAATRPVMFIPENRRPFWPTALFVLGVCGVLAALYFLFRAS